MLQTMLGRCPHVTSEGLKNLQGQGAFSKGRVRPFQGVFWVRLVGAAAGVARKTIMTVVHGPRGILRSPCGIWYRSRKRELFLPATEGTNTCFWAASAVVRQPERAELQPLVSREERAPRSKAA